jgi:hypothetical protein
MERPDTLLLESKGGKAKMTLEDKVCEILREQYNCYCDRTGSPQSIRVGIPDKVGRFPKLDYCPAVKQIVRLFEVK